MIQSHRSTCVRRFACAVAFAAAAILPVTLPQAARAQAAAADYIVAVVNSEPVTNSEVRQRLLRTQRTLRQQGQPLPPVAALTRQVLDDLIAEKAQLQLAQQLGIRVDDAIVDQAERSVARQNGLEVDGLRQRLAADGVTQEQFRQTLRNQITLQRLRERELDRQVRVTELDIDRFLAEQRRTPDLSQAQVRLAHVLVAVPESATAEQAETLRQRADQVAARAREGADFGALAREFSQGAEREQGGDMGLRPLDRYPTLFAEAVSGRSVGSVLGPLRSGAGFHVLKVIDVQQEGGLFGRVTQTRARHILLRTGPQLTEQQARERLADYRRRVANGLAQFADLAREFSQDGSAAQGGDLGWASPGQFVPEFEEVMDGLRPGDISAPVVSRFGVHLIQVMERRESTLTPQQQRDVARNLVRERKLDEAYATWAQEVRGRAYVELREPPQ